MVWQNTHGMSRTPVYRVWVDMLSRCTNAKHCAFKYYGGRGIAVCNRWEDFENFLHDMGFPAKGLTLERVDNNGHYCLENCRWITRAEQARNRRSNRMIEHGGERFTLYEWSEKTGLSPQVIHYRLKHLWSVADALTVPANVRNRRYACSA